MTAVLLCPPGTDEATWLAARAAGATEAGYRAFFAKVRLTESGCWEWIGAKGRFGYGCIRIQRRLYQSHRLSYSWFVGSLGVDRVVRHRCDNPPCVNPAHLEIGTHADNVRDTISRGRKVQAVGVRIATAKLDPAKVREIRALAKQGMLSQRAIGRRYGVSHAVIGAIIRRRFWKQVGDEP
jgi:hypothetical protein